MKVSQLCRSMESALKSGRFDDAISLGESVLKVLPCHLWAQCLLGQAYLAYGREEEARACFWDILERDPECTSACRGLALLSKDRTHRSEKAAYPPQGHSQLNRFLQPSDNQLWQRSFPSKHSERAYTLWRMGSLQEAAEEAWRVHRMAPQALKPILILTDVAWQRGDREAFAKMFHQAQSLDPSGVVACQVWGASHPLLRVLSLDPLITGERMDQGQGNAKQHSGPVVSSNTQEVFTPPVSLPWLLDRGFKLEESTALPSGQQAKAIPQSDPIKMSSKRSGLQRDVQVDGELLEIESELERIASLIGVSDIASVLPSSGPKSQSTRKSPKRVDVPLQLIVSNRTALETKYGATGASSIHDALVGLADATRDDGFVQAQVIYLDDTETLRPYGLLPVDPRDPQELRSTLDLITERLRDGRDWGDEESRTSILLVGGDDIVPFFQLADDSGDEESPLVSDHPYACRGESYLSIERAVGRLPDGASQDTDFLLRIINAAIDAHRSRRKRSSLLQELGGWLGRSRSEPKANSLGYTASIWRRAARAVFSAIGQPGHIRTSPPLTHEQMPSSGSVVPRFGYFNLHGLRNSAYWYGHRDPTYAAGYPLYPVAIQPHNVPSLSGPGSVVFSEACYGAHILNKVPASSLALCFLDAEAMGVIGSTALAYGGIDTPLVGADLLARSFWDQVTAGYPLGEALRRAKQALIQDMLARQGYLDPEDNKTILSFILYGDPTLVVADRGQTRVTGLSRQDLSTIQAFTRGRGTEATTHLGIVTTQTDLDSSPVCRRRKLEPGLIAPELITHAKERLASHLPSSMWDDITLATQTLCDGKHCHGQGSTGQTMSAGRITHGQKTGTTCKGCPSGQTRLVMTLQQSLITPQDNANGSSSHQQIVRVTLDSRGDPVKIVISH